MNRLHVVSAVRSVIKNDEMGRNLSHSVHQAYAPTPMVPTGLL